MAYSLAQRWATPQSAHAKSNLLQVPQLWMQRLFWRSELATLDREQIRDCGLDPTMVQEEANKPFWRD
jgi:uncharacterized protein YjiS (DUF1127 family)